MSRATVKQVGATLPPPPPLAGHVSYLSWLTIIIFPVIFSSGNSHIDRDRRPRVEPGRGHEGVAPRCATLCAALHQLRRFKGKCRRLARGSLHAPLPEIHWITRLSNPPVAPYSRRTIRRSPRGS